MQFENRCPFGLLSKVKLLLFSIKTCFIGTVCEKFELRKLQMKGTRVMGVVFGVTRTFQICRTRSVTCSEDCSLNSTFYQLGLTAEVNVQQPSERYHSNLN